MNRRIYILYSEHSLKRNNKMAKKKLLFKGPDWDFNIINKTYDAIEKICTEELGCDT